MARDLELPITAPGAAATAASIAGVAKQVDNLGDESARAARQVDKLNDELAETDRTMKRLAGTFAETGSRDVAKQMRELARTRATQRRALSELTPKVPSVPSVPGGGAAGGGLFSQALGTPLMPAAIGMGIIASPAIGAAINGAILAGIGSAGIGAGIASAIRQDDAIQNEFRRLGQDFVQVFNEMGEPFVQPVRGAASFLRAELRGISGEWIDSVGGMATSVEPLTRGIAGLFRNVTPGFAHALEAARPVVEALADELPGLGRDLANMLDSLADGSEGAADGIRLLTNATGDFLRFAGQAVEMLSDFYDGMTKIAMTDDILAANLFGWWAPWLKEAAGGYPQIKAASDGFDLMGDEAEDAAREVKGLNEAMSNLLDRFLTMDELNLQVAEGLAAVRESIRENGTALDINSEQGRANQEVLLAQIRTLNTIRQTNLDNNMSVVRANQIYNEQYAALVKLAAGMGVSRAALEAFLGKYNQLQSKTVTLTVRQVILSGGTKASVPVGGGMAFFADGGPILGPGARGVDSQLVVAAPGEYMLNTDMVDQLGGVQALERIRKGGSAFMSMPATGGGSSSGGGGTAISINYSGGGSGLDSLFVSWFHEAIRTGRIQLAVRNGQTRVGVG